MSLSPQLVQQIIQNEEITTRSSVVTRETAELVFRLGRVIGSSIDRFGALPRGMDEARKRIKHCEEEGGSFASGAVIVADELQGGKGRFKRWWHAPEGGLWMTLVMVNTLLPVSSRLYPLAAGISCCEAIRHYLPQARIKWVNDVHVDGKKLAGILTESMIGSKHGEEYILIGLGINVNNAGFPVELSDLAVSMGELLGAEIDLELFAARLLAKLSWNIGLLHYEENQHLQAGGEEGGGHSILLNRYRELCDSVGRKVQFGFDVQEQPQFKALVQRIDQSGGIVLQPDQSSVPLVEHSGEIVYID